jgi:hypothetical protein
MRTAVALVLSLGSKVGVASCAVATVLYALGWSWAPEVALGGVLVLLATPLVRLAVVARGFLAERRPRVALAALAVLAALLAVAVRAALRAAL